MRSSAMGRKPWTSPAPEDLLPDLSVEERRRFQPPLPERHRIRICANQPPPMTAGFEGRSDSSMIPMVRQAVDHYNARHPGGEFDVVKPLTEASTHFRGHLWWHLNFWARSRSTKKIMRFFAEVHYDPGTGSISSDQSYLLPSPIVELCSIMGEPLDQYKKSCAFCCSHLDILHPVGGQTFVCGNEPGMAPGPAELLRRGRPLEFRKLPGLRFLQRTPSIPGPMTPSDPGMPPWMPSMADAVRVWDAKCASDDRT